MKIVTESGLSQTLANIIKSQSPIQKGSARQSKPQGQSVAVQLNMSIPGFPSVIRAFAFNPIQVGSNNVSLVRLSEPINGCDWGAFSGSPSQVVNSRSEVNVSQTPQSTDSRKIKIEIKIGYTGKL